METMAGPFGCDIVDEGWRKGPWTPEEDRMLIEYVRVHGEGRWNSVAKLAGLKRNGKSSRLRWVNYLRPDLKRGKMTPQEENIIVELHARWGNRWSTIARSLPGRTDNEIKNYWRTHFKKNGKSSQNAERAKKRALKRQEQKQLQQQRQQLWLQQHQLQHQQTLQLQLDQHQQQQTLRPQFDPKKLVTQLEPADYRVPILQSKTETALMGAMIEHQYMSTMFHVDSSPPEAALSDEGLWGGLWNLEDIWANWENTCATSRAMEENQVAPSFSPGFFN